MCTEGKWPRRALRPTNPTASCRTRREDCSGTPPLLSTAPRRPRAFREGSRSCSSSGGSVDDGTRPQTHSLCEHSETAARGEVGANAEERTARRNKRRRRPTSVCIFSYALARACLCASCLRRTVRRRMREGIRYTSSTSSTWTSSGEPRQVVRS